MALDALAKQLGLAPQHTVAFGDSGNDLSMLRWAGRGFAVANGEDCAKEAADEVLPLTNDQHGVAAKCEEIAAMVAAKAGGRGAEH